MMLTMLLMMVATINSLERMEGDDNSDYNVDTKKVIF